MDRGNWRGTQGYGVGRKRIRRRMRQMGLTAIYRKPRTSKPNPAHKIYPYLLRDLRIDQPNQVWSADITYIPMHRGFQYLVVIMDWATRTALSWRLSNTLDSDFCVEGLGRLWPSTVARRSSTPIRDANSPARISPLF